MSHEQPATFFSSRAMSNGDISSLQEFRCHRLPPIKNDALLTETETISLLLPSEMDSFISLKPLSKAEVEAPYFLWNTLVMH